MNAHEHRWTSAGQCAAARNMGGHPAQCFARRCTAPGCGAKARPASAYCAEHRARAVQLAGARA